MAIYIDKFPGRVLNTNGNQYLYFGGTSYLGLQDDTEFQDIFIKNIKQYGTNYSASRKSNVRFTLFKDAENYLANLTGSEGCLTLSSGYLAGQFVSEFIHKKPCKPFYAPNTHSALFRNKVKNYVTYASLNIAVRNYLNDPNAKTPVLFLDTIDFSGGSFPNFESLKILPLKEMIIVADDSHGIGIVGANGCGVYNALKALNPKELLVCCSLGKGFAIQAGAVFGDKSTIEAMETTSFFGGASPACPSAMATFMEAENIYNKRRAILRNNIELFLSQMTSLKKFRYMNGHPTFTFQNIELVKYLERHKIVVTNFNYPKPTSETMSRIVISAAHSTKDIKKLTSVLNSFFSNL